jgi:hypothetical protein
LVSNWVSVGSDVGFTPDMKTFNEVSGMKGFVQVAATWFLEGQAKQILWPGLYLAIGYWAV